MRRLSFRLVPSQYLHPLSRAFLLPRTQLPLSSRCYSALKEKQAEDKEPQEDQMNELDEDYLFDLENQQEEISLPAQNIPHGSRKVFYPPGSVRYRLQQLIEPLDGVQIPELYENLNFEEQIEPAIQNIRDIFSYNGEQLKYLLKRNKKAFTSQSMPQVVRSFYLQQLQFPYEQVRSLVLRGPVILLKSQAFLQDQYNVMKQTLQLTDEEILFYLLKVPELLHWSGTYHILEILDRFELYMGWDQAQVAALFRQSPWMLAQTIDKIEALLKLFKGYKFDQKVLYEVLLKDGSIFGTPPSVMRESIRLLRNNFNLKSREILNTVLTKHPQYLLQSKFNALSTKLKLLRQNGCSELMIKRVFQHYPEFYLKSISSFQAKIKYLKKSSRIDLENNPYFPLCLMFDFRSVIYPRLECLGSQRAQQQDLAQVLRPTDEQFCEIFQISLEELESKKLGELKEEKDILWRYVANI